MGGNTLCDEKENVVGNTEKQRRFYQLNGIVIEDFSPFGGKEFPKGFERGRREMEAGPILKLYIPRTIKKYTY